MTVKGSGSTSYSAPPWSLVAICALFTAPNYPVSYDLNELIRQGLTESPALYIPVIGVVGPLSCLNPFTLDCGDSMIWCICACLKLRLSVQLGEAFFKY